MTRIIHPDLYGDLIEVASRSDFADWTSMVRSIGGCSEPIHLWGDCRAMHTGTGELITRREPGRLLVACGNRRAARCPSCSEIYRADTFQLIKAGLVGGKSVPDTVAGHPKVFATFTAPSFGPVHHRVMGRDGKPKCCHPTGPIRCRQRHRADDSELGRPLDPGTYDYLGAVIWNALSTRLWAFTVQLLNRAAARLLGVPQRTWTTIGRVSVAKVAEFQARGVVHFHAIIRLDGPEPGDPPPAGATVDLLIEAIRDAAAAAHVDPPDSEILAALGVIRWGDQLDVRPVINRVGDDKVLSDGQVAGYIAKYATKGAEASGTIHRSITCRHCKGAGRHLDNGRSVQCGTCSATGARCPLNELGVDDHAAAMIMTCWNLGGRAELEHLRLRPWAHMLGFRGHFSTKSRRYSVTLGCLRNVRRDWRTAQIFAAHGLDADTPVRRCQVHELDDLDQLAGGGDTVLVIGSWAYVGRGHSAGEAIFARTIAEDMAENRRIARQVRDNGEWQACDDAPEVFRVPWQVSGVPG
jgi:hypothetical protein